MVVYTQAQVQAIDIDRRLTTPDWWYNGGTPDYVAGVDSLPTGASLNSSTGIITVAQGASVSFDGWDFGTYAVLCYGNLTSFTHNRLKVAPVLKSQRVGFLQGSIDREPCLTLDPLYQATTVGDFEYNLFEGNGSFGPAALIQSRVRGSTHPVMPLMNNNSFLGYSNDGIKLSWSGTVRQNYFDPACNIPPDFKYYSAGTAYDLGDVIYDDPSGRIRVSTKNNNTDAPDFSSATASNASWLAYDPHADTITPFDTPDAGETIFEGNYFARGYLERRFPDRTPMVGTVNALRCLPNSGAMQLGDVTITNNIFTIDDEIKWTNDDIAVSNTSGDQVIDNNWHQGVLLSASRQAFSNVVSYSGNTSGYVRQGPATLSNIVAQHANSLVTYSYRSTTKGWMRVVVWSTSGARTAAEILAAVEGEGDCLAVFEIDGDENTTLSRNYSLNVNNGTPLYIDGLFQRGGGVDTLATQQYVLGGGTAPPYPVIDPSDGQVPVTITVTS